MFYLFGPLTLLIGLGAAGFYVWLRWRRLRTNTITNALALLVGQNLPLVDGLRAMARGERGANRRILDNLAKCLATGETLANSVREAHRAIPGEVLGAIQAGEEAGTLPTVLRGIDRQVRDRTVRSMGATPTIAYGALLVLFVLAQVFMITVFLVPKYRDIFADFGVHELPWATELLISVFGKLHGEYLILWTLSWLAILSLLIQFLIGRHFVVRVPDRMQPLFRILDGFCWLCPGLRQIAQTRALARQLPVLSASVRAGHNLPAAAEHAAFVDANWFARRRMTHWARQMHGGLAPAEAARRAHLPAPVCRLGTQSRSQEEMNAELSYLSSYYERLAYHWERVAAACAMPVLVLIASVFVGFVVIAFYLPMKHLMDSLTGTMY